MWAIIKFDKKNINFLIKNFNHKLGSKVQFYKPKMIIQKLYNNKVVSKEIDLLGDYMFCFHEKIGHKSIINLLKYTKGLKYFLEGFKESQKEIISFIKKSKSAENKKGYLSREFYELCLYKSYKINSGPFSNVIFKIVELQSNKIETFLGNLKTSIRRKKFILTPS